MGGSVVRWGYGWINGEVGVWVAMWLSGGIDGSVVKWGHWWLTS